MSLERDVVLDRDHLIDRLQHLRAIVPVFAQELASARRQAAQLRVENGRLLEEVRRLHERFAARTPLEPIGVISSLDVDDALGSSAENAS